GASLLDFRGVGVEHPVIVRLAVLGEDFAQLLVRLITVGLEAIRDYSPAAERHDCALQRRIRLKTDDDLPLPVDIARPVREYPGRHLRDVEHAFLAFLGEQRLQCFPHGARARGGALEKFAVPFVRRVVALNEVTNVDAALPRARLESPPCGSRKLAYLFWIGCHGPFSCLELLEATVPVRETKDRLRALRPPGGVRL